jgi:hypothetical protein
MLEAQHLTKYKIWLCGLGKKQTVAILQFCKKNYFEISNGIFFIYKIFYLLKHQ